MYVYCHVYTYSTLESSVALLVSIYNTLVLGLENAVAVYRGAANMPA